MVETFQINSVVLQTITALPQFVNNLTAEFIKIFEKNHLKKRKDTKERQARLQIYNILYHHQLVYHLLYTYSFFHQTLVLS